MDAITLVEEQIDDGQRLLAQLSKDRFAVRAAGWIKPANEDRWSLYIASPAVDKHGSAKAYADVLKALRALGNVWITGSDLKLIGESHPLVQDMLSVQQRPSGGAPTRLRIALPGGIPVEDIHLYPLRKERVTIYGLVYSGAPISALHLSLEPHNPNSRLEVGRNGNHDTYPAKTGLDWVVGAPEGAKLERNRIGLMELVWDFHGKPTRSSANEIWSLANLGLHGFSFLQEPEGAEAD